MQNSKFIIIQIENYLHRNSLDVVEKYMQIHCKLINFTSQIVNILLEHGLLIVEVEQFRMDVIHLVAVFDQLVEDVVEILQLLFTKK